VEQQTNAKALEAVWVGKNSWPQLRNRLKKSMLQHDSFLKTVPEKK